MFQWLKKQSCDKFLKQFLILLWNLTRSPLGTRKLHRCSEDRSEGTVEHFCSEGNKVLLRTELQRWRWCLNEEFVQQAKTTKVSDQTKYNAATHVNRSVEISSQTHVPCVSPNQWNILKQQKNVEWSALRKICSQIDCIAQYIWPQNSHGAELC